MARKNSLVVPIDGSDNSLRALAHAAKRFERGGFHQLVGLHVQAPLPSSSFVSREMIAEYHERQSEEAFRAARRWAERRGVAVTWVTACEDPAVAIAGFVRKGDEIVMGTRGRGGIAGLLLGSTATKVVHLAEVPVTLVK